MKRRDTLYLIPLGITALAGGSALSGARDMHHEKPSTPLSLRYLEKVRDMLTWIRRTQSENLLEASHAVARTILNGRTCWYSWDMGHSVQADIFPGRTGVPALFTVGYNPKTAKEGDLMLASIWNGVNAYISGMGFRNQDEDPMTVTPADVRKRGVLIIGAPAPWGMDAKGDEKIVYDSAKFTIRPSSAIWIETNITKLGAVMNIPGAGAPFGPVSGVIGMVTFWMIAADACRILAREGKSLPVDGGGPELSGNDVPWVGLDDPLMDDYFDTALRQLEMIEAEMGDIRTIAEMAVDAVLSGGKVYCYSRDRNALAYESQTRRGGLALTRGLYDEDGALSVFGEDFQGTSKDIVIMGIQSPDDPVDLGHLDTFRRHGLKVASIGPMTRGLKIPGGRTVPKEADVHTGRMCDTNGLFAVPGFGRKVCPTSGVCLNQIFWAVCMEIMDGIIRRTGNVPGVYLTGAVEGGIDHLNRVNRIYEQCGY
ncbi:MAG: hypothetical protein J7M24_06905 [Candidatus Latescibacteria bacterium]|nr:hypothetical protein [Candidatus Latescibacterota bacterium]